jgi:hypothetical protein
MLLEDGSRVFKATLSVLTASLPCYDVPAGMHSTLKYRFFSGSTWSLDLTMYLKT